MKHPRLALTILVILLLSAVIGPVPGALAADKLPYWVDVDLVNQIVTVYTNDGSNAIVMQGLCSSGAKNATPTGTYRMPPKKRDTERTEWFHFRAYGGYARYATRVYMDVMFHSLLYSRPSEAYINQESVENLGYAVSHGCIRMRWEDAKFIAENCPVGTKVKIHSRGERDEELRSLLYQSSFHAEDGQSYNHFLGIPDEPGILGKNSTGEAVRELHLKLKDLGIYTGKITDKYSLSTVRAVREAQSLLGMPQTGMATLEFQEAITSPDAPSAMNVTLQHGDSGPAVRGLQRNLQALMLYGGDVDGVFDVDVSDAVRTFQNAYGFAEDGVADPTLQKAVYYEAVRVRAHTDGVDGCHMKRQSREFYMGRVNCDVGIKLRKEPSAESESLMSLRNGTTVIGLEYGPKWSRVVKNGVTGYVMNTYMEYFTKETFCLDYMDGDGQVLYTIGITDLNESPAEKFTAYLASGGSPDAHEDLVESATALETVELRVTPSEGGEVVGTIPQGARADVLLKSSEWSLVAYDGVQGYLPNEMAEFHLGPVETAEAEAVETAEVYENDTTESAAVAPHEGGSAPVYESGDESSPVLGSLKPGVRVNVIQTLDGWSQIELEGHQGYIKEIDLDFINT